MDSLELACRSRQISQRRPKARGRLRCAGRDRVGTLSSMRSRLTPSVIGGRHMKLLSELAHDHFFPEPDSPELGPFTRAFMHMMFAHVEFERRVAELAGVITLKSGLRRDSCPGAQDERPKKFTDLCARKSEQASRRLAGSRCYRATFMRHPVLCNERNWLAHGVWWRIDTVAGIIDVHAVRVRRKVKGLPAASSPSNRSSRSRNCSKTSRPSSGNCRGRSRLACRRNHCHLTLRPPLMSAETNRVALKRLS